jgi:hypothetical protein
LHLLLLLLLMVCYRLLDWQLDDVVLLWPYATRMMQACVTCPVGDACLTSGKGRGGWVLVPDSCCCCCVLYEASQQSVALLVFA